MRFQFHVYQISFLKARRTPHHLATFNRVKYRDQSFELDAFENAHGFWKVHSSSHFKWIKKKKHENNKTYCYQGIWNRQIHTAEYPMVENPYFQPSE